MLLDLIDEDLEIDEELDIPSFEDFTRKTVVATPLCDCLSSSGPPKFKRVKSRQRNVEHAMDHFSMEYEESAIMR